jgi:hypothetical protein
MRMYASFSSPAFATVSSIHPASWSSENGTSSWIRFADARSRS